MKGPDADLGNSECRGESLNPGGAVPDRSTVSLLSATVCKSGLSERGRNNAYVAPQVLVDVNHSECNQHCLARMYSAFQSHGRYDGQSLMEIITSVSSAYVGGNVRACRRHPKGLSCYGVHLCPWLMSG